MWCLSTVPNEIEIAPKLDRDLNGQPTTTFDFHISAGMTLPNKTIHGESHDASCNRTCSVGLCFGREHLG